MLQFPDKKFWILIQTACDIKADEIPDEGKIVFNGIEKKWFRYLVIDPHREWINDSYGMKIYNILSRITLISGNN